MLFRKGTLLGPSSHMIFLPFGWHLGLVKMKVPGALGEYTMYPIISQSVTDDI